MREVAVLLTCISTAGAAQAGEIAPLTPHNITVQVEAHGAKAVLAQIYRHKGDWGALLKGISGGTVAWLQIANLLRPGSDAGATEQLELALGEALEHRPDNVLKIGVPVFGLNFVCGGPDIDDARYDSYYLAMRAIDRRIRKLRSVSQASLLKLRDECIRSLEDSKSGLASAYGVTQQRPAPNNALEQTRGR